jgi:hypothetical protein
LAVAASADFAMATKQYQFGALRFEGPADCFDATTLNLVVTSGPAHFRPSVVMARDLKGKKGLGAYVEAQFAQLKKQYARFTVERSDDAVLAGHKAIRAEARFVTKEQVEVRQIQAFIELPEVFLLVTLTDRADDFESLRPMFERVLATLQVD